ncbi:hypothetical protein [Biformimicrobium ophioploci]|uniref:Sel1 repeat family protein n=1 Tax=Biformimicrobium ophioploci TaxID=3036711 RepID=A0ABQ6LYR0_9GAMM|nr:hypothetical protein [Microbulbifer sp. NKW57]GMG87203.1 hypothetical protein MNKW57_15240 [Microbulbifer sp. NKW57]
MRFNNALPVIAAICLSLAGCASAPSKQASEPGQFSRLVQDWQVSGNKPAYPELWSAYVQTGQYENWLEQKNLRDALRSTDGEVACEGVDWNEISGLHFWSVSTHLDAADCLDRLGDSTAADFHESAASMLVTGMLGSGDGLSAATAFEVPVWSEADELLELAGYELLDNYVELDAESGRLYYVLVGNQRDSGTQRHFYFQNQQVLGRLLGVGEVSGEATGDLPMMQQVAFVAGIADQVYSAKLAWAEISKTAERYDIAEQWYQNSIAAGGVVASYRLGLMCLERGMQEAGTCVDYLLDAAEMGYIPAVVAVAYAQREGLGVEADPLMAERLLAGARKRIQPAAIERALAAVASARNYSLRAALDDGDVEPMP